LTVLELKLEQGSEEMILTCLIERERSYYRATFTFRRKWGAYFIAEPRIPSDLEIVFDLELLWW